MADPSTIEGAMERLKELRTPAEEQIHNDEIAAETESQDDEIVEEDIAEPESNDEAGDYADEEEADENVPTFDPPAAWSADGKEAFEQLDPALQEEIVNREMAAERGLRQKLDEAAETRKAAEAEAQALAEAKEQVAIALQQAVAATDNLQPPDAKLLDPYSDNYDADEYNRQRAVYEQKLAERNTRVEQLNTYRSEQEQEAIKKRGEQIRLSEQTLLTKFPEWTDPVKGQKAVQEIRSYIVSEGVPQEVAANVYDSTMLTIANKAMLYDRLQNAEKKVKAKPKVGRSSKQRTRQPKSDVEAARKAHSEQNTVESAARLMRAQRQAQKV